MATVQTKTRTDWRQQRNPAQKIGASAPDADDLGFSPRYVDRPGFHEV
jgi:hypothetical protein